MSQFNIALSPLLPWPIIIALAVGAIVVTALGLYTARRGVWLRALGLALIIFALTDPSLVREDRQPLKDVVAVVIDESASQSIRERPMQTAAARKAIEEARAKGVAVVCLSVGSDADAARLEKVYGATNYLGINRTEQLTTRLRRLVESAIASAAKIEKAA